MTGRNVLRYGRGRALFGNAGAIVAKRAYLMASGAEAGARFSVTNSSGTTVYSAPVGGNLGKWSASYPDVYALDFPSVTTAGAYTISVGGASPARSPGSRLGAAATGDPRAPSNSLSAY